MARIEIVSHCYAMRLPHYAAALAYQLTSLWDWRKWGVDVTVLACVCEKDRKACDVLQWFRNETGLPICTLHLDEPDMSRRCIGRNHAAKTTTADIVWFADCDQAFLGGSLESLAGMKWPEGASMIYPKEIMIHKDHETGDLALASDRPGLRRVDESEFVSKAYDRAIGGVQIVRGEFARAHGYLDGIPKWQRPKAVVLGDFKDDVAYRKFCLGHGSIVPVRLPGMHRIRHSRTSYQ